MSFAPSPTRAAANMAATGWRIRHPWPSQRFAAQRSLRRNHKGGAGCLSGTMPELRGGRRATGVPTAIDRVIRATGGS